MHLCQKECAENGKRKLRQEVKYSIYGLIPVIILAGIFYAAFYTNGSAIVKHKIYCDSARPVYPYIRMLDTIHLLGDEYIEIILPEQLAILHRRNDTSLTFKISTGNPFISKGMRTPEGFFTVQTMLEVATSRQFNNAKLLYWIGFNGNIGFHGLRTSGYYAHLGRRPSSHGCVRIARKDAKSLYSQVHKGTPVIVRKDTPAVRIVFSGHSEFNPRLDFLLGKNSRINDAIMKARRENLIKGLALMYNNGRVFHDGKTVMRPRGFDIGLDSLVPDRQKPPLFKRIICLKRDNVFYKLEPVFKHTEQTKEK